jgi:Polyketide cyclase / dehydrase and lipid transport
MTVTAEIETRIGRPPADVFAALIDVERYPEWLIASGIVRVERLDPGPLDAGTRLRIHQTVAGRSTVFDGTVTVLAPGAAFGVRGRDKDGVTIEIDTVLALDELATRLRWSLRLGLPLRFRMFESMVAPQARRAAALDLEALKRRLESATAG